MEGRQKLPKSLVCGDVHHTNIRGLRDPLLIIISKGSGSEEDLKSIKKQRYHLGLIVVISILLGILLPLALGVTGRKNMKKRLKKG